MQPAKEACERLYNPPKLMALCLATLGNRISGTMDVAAFRSMLRIFHPGMPNCLNNMALNKCCGGILESGSNSHFTGHELLEIAIVDRRVHPRRIMGNVTLKVCGPCVFRDRPDVELLGYYLADPTNINNPRKRPEDEMIYTRTVPISLKRGACALERDPLAHAPSQAPSFSFGVRDNITNDTHRR